jgi:predicted transcriptional regulator
MVMDFRWGKEINCIEDYPMTSPNPTCTKSDFNWPVGFGKDRNLTVYG